MQQRGRICTIVIGKKMQGKSTFIANMVTTVQAALQERTVIIVDNDPPAYNQFERIDDYNTLYRLLKGKGIAKFYDFNPDDEKVEETILKYLRQHFRNGTLVIEDASPFVSHTASNIIKRWFTNHKNYGVDLVVTFHSLRMVPEFLRNMAHNIVLFKTQDNLDINKNELRKMYAGCWDSLYTGWKKVNTAPETKNYIQPYVIIETGL